MERMQHDISPSRRDSLNLHVENMKEISDQCQALLMEANGWQDSNGQVKNTPDTRTIIAQSLFLSERMNQAMSQYTAAFDHLKDKDRLGS